MPTVAPYRVSRLLNAPRELVYQVHTEPTHLAHWAGPAGFEAIHAAMDLRVGGRYHYGLQGPGGAQMWGLQVFRDIVPGHKLVYLQSFSDKDGGLTRHPMAPAWPLEMHATVTFDDAGPALSRLGIEWLPHASDAAGQTTFDSARAGMDQGFGGMFSKLDAYLAQLHSLATGRVESVVSFPGDDEMVFARRLAAPPARVWSAYTDPAQVVTWWGPEGFTNITHEMAVTVGGVWKLMMRGPDGTDYPNKLTYLEVTPPTRLVADHGDFERVQFRVEIDFQAEGGQTLLVSKLRFTNPDERDAIAAYAVPGHASTMRRLEAHLAGR